MKMTLHEWEMIMLLEIDDFIAYWNRHVVTAGWETEKSFKDWLDLFSDLQDDRR